MAAVREAEIVDPVLPQRSPHHVHVARRRRGSDVRQEVGAHPVQALRGELLVELLDVGHSRGAVVGHRLGAVGIELGVGAAPQLRCRVPHATGVDADQVEALQDLGIRERRPHPGHGVHRRRTGPARVDDEDADPRAGGGHLDDRQLRLSALGFRVVDGDSDRPALRGRQLRDVGDYAYTRTPHQRSGVRRISL